MSSNQSTYLLCDNTKILKRVVKALKRAPAILLDCEAHDIGYVGGKLSLISLGVTSSLPSSNPRIHPHQPVFIVDVLAFSRPQLRPLYDILEDQDIRKVVFGGRHDFSELYHGQDVYLRGVFDLQIADIATRSMRGEGFEEQMGRLGRYLDPRALRESNHRTRYEHVHRLGGLVACVQEHDINTESIPHKLKPHHSTKWLKRPLSTDQLIYAAGDILLIDLLYDHFDMEGYLDIQPFLETESEQYISLHLGGRVVKNDPYWSHPLLPLEIVHEMSGEDVKCQGCERRLPTGCFPHRKKGRRSKSRVREDNCFVCSAIDYVHPPSDSETPFSPSTSFTFPPLPPVYLLPPLPQAPSFYPHWKTMPGVPWPYIRYL